jgi:predicted small lipoprotein YifL
MKVTNAPAARILARAAILFAALSALCLLLAGCGRAGAAQIPASAKVASTVRAVDPQGVFGRVLNQPYVTVTGGRFYVTWQNQPRHNVPSTTLVRADRATGRIEAARTFSTGYISPPQAAGGSLWALLATTRETLLRMDPDTLAVTGKLPISNGQNLNSSGFGNHLSVAGGALWAVAGDRLVRVSPRTGRPEKVIDLPGGFSTSMAGNSSGSVLIVSVADSGGRGSMQRRDPVSGALLASRATVGVTAADIGGVIGSGVWAAQPTGMQGFVQRYSTRTLAPARGTAVEGSNGIRVVVADGLAWVLRAGPEEDASYCANPVTGKKLAAIARPRPAQDDVIGVWGRDVYYAAPAVPDVGVNLKRVTVPAACQVR